MSKDKKTMEYEDAPSGYVTLYNYKEPFMKFTGGYGFQGVLLFDGVSDTIQCHYCGQWFGSLPHHLRREHNMTASQYKEKVGLRQTSALISESMRQKLIASGLDKRLQNLRIQGRKTEAQKEKIRATLKKNVRETQNERGSCPEQLIDSLLKQYKENGNKTPHSKKLRKYESIINTFGSYKKACEIAGIPYNDPLEKLKIGAEKQRKYSKEIAVNYIYEFFIREGRLPKYSDYKDKGLRNFLTKKNLQENVEKEAVLKVGRYNENLRGMKFTKEELIIFLRLFEKNHGRKPTYSDAKRGLLPWLRRYSYHFGSWKNALSIAFN